MIPGFDKLVKNSACLKEKKKEKKISRKEITTKYLICKKKIIKNKTNGVYACSLR